VANLDEGRSIDFEDHGDPLAHARRHMVFRSKPTGSWHSDPNESSVHN
jgi:hypothetical protein